VIAIARLQERPVEVRPSSALRDEKNRSHGERRAAYVADHDFAKRSRLASFANASAPVKPPHLSSFMFTASYRPCRRGRA